MEEMRSKSYNTYGHTFSNNNNNNNNKPVNLRCHSSSSSSYSSSDHSISNPNYYHHNREDDFKSKKGKSSSSSMNGGVGWVLGDPAEMQRKKRVASYKAYAVEGNLKGSLKKSFRWIKLRYDHLLHGRRS